MAPLVAFTKEDMFSALSVAWLLLLNCTNTAEWSEGGEWAKETPLHFGVHPEKSNIK